MIKYQKVQISTNQYQKEPTSKKDTKIYQNISKYITKYQKLQKSTETYQKTPMKFQKVPKSTNEYHSFFKVLKTTKEQQNSSLLVKEKKGQPRFSPDNSNC